MHPPASHILNRSQCVFHYQKEQKEYMNVESRDPDISV